MRALCVLEPGYVPAVLDRRCDLQPTGEHTIGTGGGHSKRTISAGNRRQRSASGSSPPQHGGAPAITPIIPPADPMSQEAKIGTCLLRSLPRLGSPISPDALGSLAESRPTQPRRQPPADVETHDKCPEFFRTFVPVIAPGNTLQYSQFIARPEAGRRTRVAYQESTNFHPHTVCMLGD